MIWKQQLAESPPWRPRPGEQGGQSLCGQEFLSVQQDLVESRDGKRFPVGADVGKMQGGPPAVELDRALQGEEVSQMCS